MAGLAFTAAAVTTTRAQVPLPIGGFASLPSFAWPRVEPAADPTRWEGTYARMSTGFLASSSKRFGSFAGPTVGFEGGKAWRDGDLLFSLGGAFEAVTPIGGSGTPGLGGIGYSRDFAGAFQAKAGAFVTDNVLVYGKVGIAGINETLRFGATAASPSFSRTDIVFRPDARIGAEWAVTDRLTVGVEVGVSGSAIR